MDIDTIKKVKEQLMSSEDAECCGAIFISMREYAILVYVEDLKKRKYKNWKNRHFKKFIKQMEGK